MKRKNFLILAVFALIAIFSGIWSFASFLEGNYPAGIGWLGPYFISLYALISLEKELEKRD